QNPLPFRHPTEYALDIGGTVKVIENEIAKAKRPLIIVGNGVRIAGAVDDFLRVFGTLGVPVVSSWGAADIMPTDHPYYIGRCGIFGDRASNLACQMADLVVGVATRLSPGQIGHTPGKFAPNAKKILIDVDYDEVFNKPTVKPQFGIIHDVKEVLG